MSETPVSKTPFFLAGATVVGQLSLPNEPTRFTRADVPRLFAWATDTGASDITITTGDQIFLEIDGRMHRVTKHILDNSEVLEIVVAMFGSESAKATLSGPSALDFAYQVRRGRNEKFRFRINCVGVIVDGALGVQITARTIPSRPPDLSLMNLESEVLANICPRQGMIVVTGGTGSGKSTLLASIVGHLVQQPDGHRKIITFEDPIEYVYDELPHPTTSIAQTQIGKSLRTFAEGTRNALRRKPTIILLGEARDAETIGEAITASMTGHLLYTTIHSNGFADTIRRMVNVFNDDRNSRAVDIVSSLRMVISQRLVPNMSGKRVAIREFVVMNDRIVDFILEAGIENLTASCRQVLRNSGQSFLQDAERKFSQGVISKKQVEELRRQDRGNARDAEEIARNAAERSQMLHKTVEAELPALSDLPETFSTLPDLAPDLALDPSPPDLSPPSSAPVSASLAPASSAPSQPSGAVSEASPKPKPVKTLAPSTRTVPLGSSPSIPSPSFQADLNVSEDSPDSGLDQLSIGS